MEEQPLLNRLLASCCQTFSRTFRRSTKNQLGLQRPIQRNIECLGGFLIGQWVVVLQVAAQSFSFQGRPQLVLVHSSRVLGPLREFVGVDGVFGLQSLDGLGVFVEKDLFWKKRQKREVVSKMCIY